jgi:hypothetical protein
MTRSTSYALIEPVEPAASVIEIAILELIDRIREAPKALKDLNADLLSFQQLLGSLEAEIRSTPDASLSDRIKQWLEAIKPALEECSKACGEFKANLSRITPNMSTLSGTPTTASGTIKYARAFDNSMQLIGTIGIVPSGGPVNTIDVIIAQDRARQMGGKIEGGIALSFMNELSA